MIHKTKQSAAQKCAFFDRDGVINKEVDYLHKIDDFEFLPNVFETLKAYQKNGFAIVIVTNQAGIGRGYYTEKDFDVLTTWMLGEFKKEGITITDVYYCPHHPSAGIGEYMQNCECRKPNPGMLNLAIMEHNIDPRSSIMFGDKVSDIQAGINAGISKNVFVETGHTIAESDKVLADMVISELTFIQPD